MYSFIKQYYDEGFYTNDDVKVFVTAAWITSDEYEQITSVAYTV